VLPNSLFSAFFKKGILVMKYNRISVRMISACVVLTMIMVCEHASRSVVIHSNYDAKSIVNAYLKIEDSTEKTTIIKLNGNSSGSSWTGAFHSIGGTYKFWLTDAKGSPLVIGTKSAPVTYTTKLSVTPMVNGRVTRGENYNTSQNSTGSLGVLTTFTKVPAGIASISITTVTLTPTPTPKPKTN
jgi:hypothetical protein